MIRPLGSPDAIARREHQDRPRPLGSPDGSVGVFPLLLLSSKTCRDGSLPKGCEAMGRLQGLGASAMRRTDHSDRPYLRRSS